MGKFHSEEIEQFTRKYMSELFTVIAVIIGTISSIFHFYTGPILTIICFSIGICVGLLFSLEKYLLHFYEIAEKSRTSQAIWGSAKALIAIFVPFILFLLIGCLVGIAHRDLTKKT